MPKEINAVVEELGTAFEEFKAAHTQQLAEIKAGRGNEAVLNDKIERLGARMDELQAQKDALETKFNRPNMGGDEVSVDERKALAAMNVEIKAAAASAGRPQPQDIDLDSFRAYKRGFAEWARKGERALDEACRKALQVGVDVDGGFLVPADVSGRIVTKVYELSPIRKISAVQPISSDRLEGIEDLGEAAAGWVSEVGARGDSTTPQVGKYEIVAHEMYGQPKATQKLLDDSSVDIEAWLAAKTADKFARVEGTAFVAGTGVGQPRGFTTYTTAATADGTRAWGQIEHVVTGANGAFHTTQADPLFDLIAAFRPDYLANARWVTKRTVIAAIRKFKTSATSEYIWQPGLQAGQPSQILGFPVVIAEDMPALATNSLSMALGDFSRAYQIVDRMGIRTLRDPYTDKPYVKFYSTRRVGGQVVNFEALKFIKFSA